MNEAESPPGVSTRSPMATCATVVEVGGGLRTLVVGDRDVLDGYGEHELCPGGRWSGAGAMAEPPRRRPIRVGRSGSRGTRSQRCAVGHGLTDLAPEARRPTGLDLHRSARTSGPFDATVRASASARSPRTRAAHGQRRRRAATGPIRTRQTPCRGPRRTTCSTEDVGGEGAEDGAGPLRAVIHDVDPTSVLRRHHLVDRRVRACVWPPMPHAAMNRRSWCRTNMDARRRCGWPVTPTRSSGADGGTIRAG